MLVDSGSTTSFISETMVKKLGLETETCYLAKVKVANGGIMESDKMVKEVRW
jgi:predicted aspartyl protease